MPDRAERKRYRIKCLDFIIIAAYDAISRVFSQEAVIRAYYRTDPDTMALREDIVK